MADRDDKSNQDRTTVELRKQIEVMMKQLSQIASLIGCVISVPHVGAPPTLIDAVKKSEKDEVVQVPEFILKAAPTNKKTPNEVLEEMRTFSAKIETILTQQVREEAAQTSGLKLKYHDMEQRQEVIVNDSEQTGWAETSGEKEGEHPFIEQIDDGHYMNYLNISQTSAIDSFLENCLRPIYEDKDFEEFKYYIFDKLSELKTEEYVSKCPKCIKRKAPDAQIIKQLCDRFLMDLKDTSQNRSMNRSSLMLLQFAKILQELGNYRLPCQLIFYSGVLSINEFIDLHDIKVAVPTIDDKSNFLWKISEDIESKFELLRHFHLAYFSGDYYDERISQGLEYANKFLGMMEKYDLKEKKKEQLEKLFQPLK